MTYLLDTNLVSYFLQTGHEKALAAAAATCAMALVGEVRVELRNDRERGGASFEKWLAGSALTVRDIELGSPEHVTLAQLVKPLSPKDGLGERASIALAAHDPTMTFVANDRNALWLGLREIWSPGERLLGVVPFMRRLFDSKALVDPKVLDDVVALVPFQQPTWWPSWRASLPAS